MKIGKLVISIDRTKKKESRNYDNINEEYQKGLKDGKKLILGTLSARTATRTLCSVFEAHDNAKGVTERDTIPESYYRYIKYNNLQIDTAGIITLIKKGIIEDWKSADISLVFSPYFSHSLHELYKELRPHKIMFAINDPEFTVQSIYNKGIFSNDYIQNDEEKALGYQPSLDDRWSHYFGRITPLGRSEYRRWNNLTRIGKVSWWGNKLTKDIYNQLKKFPKEEVFIFNPSEADKDYYSYYKKIATEFNLKPVLTKKRIDQIRGKGFKKIHNTKHNWSEKEQMEFEEETKEWAFIYKELCG